MCGETLRKRASLSGGLLLVPAGGKRASGAGISSRQHDAHVLQEGGRFERSEESADGHSQAGQAGDAWCAHAVWVAAASMVGTSGRASAAGCTPLACACACVAACTPCLSV